MAIAFDAINNGGAGANVTGFSFTHTASGTDRIVMVWLASYDLGSGALNGIQTAYVTYGGRAMSAAGGAWTTGGTACSTHGQIFYLMNPPTGSQTIAVTMGSISFGGFRAVSVSYTGVRGVASHSYRFLPTAGTAMSTYGVESETASLVVSGWSSASLNSGTLFTSPSGTLRYNSSSSGSPGAIGIQEDTGGASSTSPTVTCPNAQWCASTVTLLPVESTSIGIASSPAFGNGVAYSTISSTAFSASLTNRLDLSGSRTCVLVGITMSLTTAAGTLTCSVTYGGVAMNQIDLQQGAATGGNEGVGLYYLFNPPTGSQTIAMTVGGTTSKTTINGSAIAYNNVNSLGSFVTGTATSTTPTLTISPSTRKERVVALYTSDDISSFTANTQTSFRFAIGSTSVTGTGDITYMVDDGGALSNTLSFTMGSSVRWRGIAIALKPEQGQFLNMF